MKDTIKNLIKLGVYGLGTVVCAAATKEVVSDIIGSVTGSDEAADVVTVIIDEIVDDEEAEDIDIPTIDAE